MVKRLAISGEVKAAARPQPTTPNGTKRSAEEATSDDVAMIRSDSDTDSSVYSGLGETDDEAGESSNLDGSGNSSSTEFDSDTYDDSDSNESVKNTDLVDDEPNTEKGVNMLADTAVAPKYDEYEYDSSDEEDIRNTIGNIPVEWYDEYKHIGYNWEGKKIMKPAPSDQLDTFLKRMDDPDYWRTVEDSTTGQNIVLSEEDVVAIKQMLERRYPDPNYDPYKPWIDFFSNETMIHPVRNFTEHKRSFVPSQYEMKRVRQMCGRMQKKNYGKRNIRKEDDRFKFYLMWTKDEADVSKRMRRNIPAPKLRLPGHEESYNPPPEYLPTPEEIEKWEQQDPSERRPRRLPQRFSSLREVPAYNNFIKERFERCLDLYLCPRQRKVRSQLKAEDLLPKLPKPKDLQPFPTTLTLVYKGHKSYVRCLSAEPYGQYLASGSEDCTVKIWEVQTGRCMSTIPMEGPVYSIAWCSNASICVIAVAVKQNVVIVNAKVGDKLVVSNTDLALSAPIAPKKAGTKCLVEWRLATEAEMEKGYRVIVEHNEDVKQVTWHCKGDYFATVISDAGNRSVVIHQLSKHSSQHPFRRPKGAVQCVLFHPSKPYFFVATQRYIRVYNLLKQVRTKRLMTAVKWISSMAVHPGGDNLIIGSYDSRLSWYDLDLSVKPYQTLRHHTKAIRQVTYHRHYPLFASASDDGSVIICHGMVYNDLLQNALLVPVKVLRGHGKKDDLSALDCQFHPTQPWIFTAGADGNIFLYT